MRSFWGAVCGPLKSTFIVKIKMFMSIQVKQRESAILAEVNGATTHVLL